RDVALSQSSTLLLQVVVGGVFHRDRFGGGRPLHRQFELGGLQSSAGTQDASVGVERAVKICNARNASGRLDKTRRCQVQALDGDLRLDRTCRNVCGVDRARLALKLCGSASGKIGGDGEGKL